MRTEFFLDMVFREPYTAARSHDLRGRHPGVPGVDPLDDGNPQHEDKVSPLLIEMRKRGHRSVLDARTLRLVPLCVSVYGVSLHAGGALRMQWQARARGARSHFSDQAASKARCDLAIRFNGSSAWK